MSAAIEINVGLDPAVYRNAPTSRVPFSAKFAERNTNFPVEQPSFTANGSFALIGHTKYQPSVHSLRVYAQTGIRTSSAHWTTIVPGSSACYLVEKPREMLSVIYEPCSIVWHSRIEQIQNSPLPAEAVQLKLSKCKQLLRVRPVRRKCGHPT
jgi:hypothetical protein